MELELFDTVRHACCGLDMPLLCMQCLWRSVCVGNAHTPHTHQRYNGYFFHPLICLWYFVSHDMHATPSSLQVIPLPSAVEAGLSNCTTLQKLTVEGSPLSVTAALLKTVTVNSPWRKYHWTGVTLVCSVCVCACVCVFMCVRVCVRVCVCGWVGGM